RGLDDRPVALQRRENGNGAALVVVRPRHVDVVELEAEARPEVWSDPDDLRLGARLMSLRLGHFDPPQVCVVGNMEQSAAKKGCMENPGDARLRARLHSKERATNLASDRPTSRGSSARFQSK